MKQIVQDYLWRWKWIYLSGFVIHCVAMIPAWQKEDVVISVGVLAGSAFLLMIDFMRSGGGARTLLALPTTAKDVARAWRFVALEFPCLIFIVGLAISAGISAMFKPTWLLNFERFTIITIFQSSLLGIVFFGLTGIPASQADQRTLGDQLRGGFFGLLWGFSIPGTFFLASLMPGRFSDFTVGHWLAGVCLVTMTVCGWLRAEKLVMRRAQATGRSAAAPAAARAREKIEPGFGGVRFLCFVFARRLMLIGLAIVLINWFGMGFFTGQFRTELDHSFTASQSSFVVPILTLITAVILFTQLRSLRALPLSKTRIAALLIGWPIAFGSVFGLVVLALHFLLFGGPAIWGTFTSSIIAASACLLVIPALLWFGFSIKAFLVIAVLLPGAQLLQIGEKSREFVVSSVWWAPALLIAISFWATWRLLDSSRPWRANAAKGWWSPRRA